MIIVKQLEMELQGGNRCPRIVRREHRKNRASWWFTQMRRVVDEAFDFEPADGVRKQPETATDERSPGLEALENARNTA